MCKFSSLNKFKTNILICIITNYLLVVTHIYIYKVYTLLLGNSFPSGGVF